MSATHTLSRHWQIFEIHVIDVVQFRLRALVWFLLGLINTGIVLLFWWATLRASGSPADAPTLPVITSYYLLMLTMASVIMCHLEEDIAYRDIQKGELYRYLLRPYPYLLKKFHIVIMKWLLII